MKKLLIGLVSMFLLSSAALADGPIGYPGSTWGQFTAPSSVIKDTAEEDNWLFIGKTTQGIDWVRFGKDNAWVFDTYASLGYSLDKNRLSYNNKLVPAVGVKLTRGFSHGAIDIGVEAVYERHFGDLAPTTPKSGTGGQAYVSYWFGW